MQWMILPFKRYADFQGRSRRMEFWMFQLLNLGLLLVLAGAQQLVQHRQQEQRQHHHHLVRWPICLCLP